MSHPTRERSATVSHWLHPNEIAADITVWPLSSGTTRHAELRGRVILSINCGPACVHLRPTADEVRAIIEALQWALTADEVPA